jgi:hypothetical protein
MRPALRCGELSVRFRVLALIGVLLSAAVPVLGQTAILIDGSLLEDDVCYSSTGAQRIASVTLNTLPSTDRIVMFDQIEQAPKITVSCVNYIRVARGSSAAVTDALCAAPIRTYLCSSPTNTEEWSCEELYEFSIAARVDVSQGSTRDDARKWRIEITPGARALACYPRQLQLVAIIFTEEASKGNEVLLGFVGLMLGCVGLCIVLFAVYTIRKHMNKMAHRNAAAAAAAPPHPDLEAVDADGVPVEPPALPVSEPVPGLEGEYAPQPLPISEVRALYFRSPLGRDAFLNPDGTVGRHHAPADRFEEHLEESRREAGMLAYRDSVYARSLRDGPLEASAVQKTDITIWSPQLRPAAMDVPTVVPVDVLDRAQHPYSPRQFNPLSRDGGGTLVCADCGAVVQDQATPRVCQASGKRHY